MYFPFINKYVSFLSKNASVKLAEGIGRLELIQPTSTVVARTVINGEP